MYPSSALFILFTIAIISAYIAKQKQRNPFLWFFFGLSTIGLFILIFLPQKTKPSSRKQPQLIKEQINENMQKQSTVLPKNFTPSPSIMHRIPHDPSIDWFFINNDLKFIGPLKLPLLRKTLIEKNLGAQTYVWCEEFDDWKQISSLQNGQSLLDKDLL